MTAPSAADFDRLYQSHLKHIKLKGLQPQTIEAYARALRRAGDYFEHRIDALTDYFTDLLASHSWSAVKLDLYGLKFFYTHVLRKPWVAPDLVKPPKAQRLPDILTVAEASGCSRPPGSSVTGSYFSPSTASAFASARACACKWETSRPRVAVFVAAIARVTRTGSYPYRRRPWRCCAASGNCTATWSCCCPTARVA